MADDANQSNSFFDRLSSQLLDAGQSVVSAGLKDVTQAGEGWIADAVQGTQVNGSGPADVHSYQAQTPTSLFGFAFRDPFSGSGKGTPTDSGSGWIVFGLLIVGFGAFLFIFTRRA